MEKAAFAEDETPQSAICPPPGQKSPRALHFFVVIVLAVLLGCFRLMDFAFFDAVIYLALFAAGAGMVFFGYANLPYGDGGEILHMPDQKDVPKVLNRPGAFRRLREVQRRFRVLFDRLDRRKKS